MECSARTAAMPLEDAMAATSRDDIPRQLAALLGRESVCQIRKTDTVPPQISVIDVAATITGKSQDAAAQDFRRMSKKYPDVSAKCTDVKFTAARGHEGLRESKGHRYRRQCRNRDAARYGISFVLRFLIGTEWYAA